MSGRVGDASPAARGTGAPIVAVRGSAAAGGLRLQRLVDGQEGWRARASELRRIAAKRGIYWLIDHQPHRPERGLLVSMASGQHGDDGPKRAAVVCAARGGGRDGAMR
jgi:hypothetical protein